MSLFIVIFGFILSYLLSVSECHFIPRIKNNPVKISGYVNQALEVDIPFKKCFQVDTQLPANYKYITFEPSSLRLTETKSGLISENKEISVLQDLRSPQSFSHEHLLVFDNYALTFISPNTFLVIKQIEGQYKVENKIIVSQINKYTQFKIYKFNDKAIILLYSEGLGQVSNDPQQEKQARAFIMSQTQYEEIKVPTKNMIAHFEGSGNQFFTAQFGDGVHCYSYSQTTKKIIQAQAYSHKAFGNLTQNLYIVDVNINSLKSHNIIYALDAMKGVFRINLTQSQKQPHIDLIVSQPNCNGLDSISVDHLVLVCQLGSSSYIVQSYATQNQKGEYVFNKLQPQYHVNYFNDLSINKNYFVVYSHRTLNVYWSSKQNNIPQTVNTRSQLDLPGLETFYFKMSSKPNESSYLYAIQSGVFKQMRISQSEARLAVKSFHPIQRKFQISIFGNCEDLPKGQLQKIDRKGTLINMQNLNSFTCQVQKIIDMQIVQQNSPRKQDFSVSASIIVILIVIFLLVIWICLKKYKGLEREARKVLEAYKKKRSRL